MKSENDTFHIFTRFKLSKHLKDLMSWNARLERFADRAAFKYP